DAESGKKLFGVAAHNDLDRFCLAFSPDGRRLAAAGADGAAVQLWQADTGKELFTLQGHGGEVLHVTFSPDGRRLASAGADGTVRLWQVDTGAELHTLRGHIKEVYHVDFSPDGRQLASAGSDKSVKVWQ